MARRPVSPASSAAQRTRPSTREALSTFKGHSPQDLLWDLLTFDRLMTGPLSHIVYWAGLLVLALGGFSVVGSAVGLSLREEGVKGVLLAIPVLVGGFLVLLAAALLWRACCEFYVAVMRIAEDLRQLRVQAEAAPLTAAVAAVGASKPIRSAANEEAEAAKL